MQIIGNAVRAKRRPPLQDWWPFFAVVAFIGFLWRTQRQILISGGAGWDGFYYLQMAKGLLAPQPFCLRIGYPMLVKWCSGPLGLLATFGVVAKVCGLVYGIASARVLQKVVPNCRPTAYFFAWSLLNLSEMSPLRQAFWYPTNTDIPVSLIFLVFTWAALASESGAKRDVVLVSSMFFGTLVRENFPFNILLVVAVDFFTFARGTIFVRADKRKLITLASCLVGVFFGFVLIRNVVGQWPIEAKEEAVFTNFLSQKLVVVLGAFLSIYSIAGAVLLAKGGGSRPVPPRWHGSAVLFLLATLPVALVGGADTARFLFWYMPILVVLLLPKINALCVDRRWYEVSILAAYFLFTHRSLLAIDVKGRNSGCSLHDFVGKTSPALGGYSRMCVASTVSIFLPAAALTGMLLVFRRVRLGFRSSDA